MAIASIENSYNLNEKLVNRMLEFAITEWRNLPELEQEFQEMDSLEQMEFMAEWNKAEEREILLDKIYSGNYMSPEQSKVYQSLIELVNKYKNIIEHIKELSGYQGKLSYSSIQDIRVMNK